MIGYADNALFVGMNGCGKSDLLNWIASELAVRRVVVDSKREFVLAGYPVHELRARDEESARAEVDAIDWDQPIVHVRHAPLGNVGAKEQLTALSNRVWRIPGPVQTLLHEAFFVSAANWCPPGFRETAVGGRAREHGLMVATQRPRNIAKEFLTEAHHVFLFPPLDVEDLKESRRGVPFLRVDQALAWTADVPTFGYLWADRRERAVAIGDPLPNELRLAAHSFIRRAEGIR